MRCWSGTTDEETVGAARFFAPFGRLRGRSARRSAVAPRQHAGRARRRTVGGRFGDR